MSPVRTLPRPRRALPALQLALAVQAVVFGAGTAVFTLGRWLPLAVGAAAGSLVLTWFLGRRTRSAWAMALGFEALLVALGAAGLQAGVDLPGAALALVLAVVLVLPATRQLFAEPPAATSTPTRLVPPPVTAARPAPPALPPPPPGLPAASVYHAPAPRVPLTSPAAPPSAPPPPPPGWHPQAV